MYASVRTAGRFLGLGLLLLTLVAPVARAQPDVRIDLPRTASDEAPAIRFERYGLTDGLVQSSVNGMIQDRHGFIWITSQGGLQKFDGEQFTVYAPVPFDTTSIAHGWGWGLIEASDGAIWTGHNNGAVSRLDPGTGRFTNFRPDPTDSTALPGGAAFSVLQTHDGTMWIGSGRGLSRMDPERSGHFVTLRRDLDDPTAISGAAYFLHEDKQGLIWSGTSDGLARVDPSTLEITVFRFTGSSTGPNRGVYEIFADPDDENVLWVASDLGIVRFDRETEIWEIYRAYPDDPEDSQRNGIAQIALDPNDSDILWLGAWVGGLLRFDRFRHAFIPYQSDPLDPNSIPSNAAWSVLADRSGTMWVGTNGSGLARFNPKSVAIAHVAGDATDPNSLARGGAIWGMLADSHGRLWVGQDDALGRAVVAVSGPRTGKTRLLRSRGSDPTTINPGGVRTIAEDGAGRIWIGTTGVAVCDPLPLSCRRYETDRDDSTRSAPGVAGAIHFSTSEPGVVWVGADGWGLERLDAETGRVKRYLNRPGDLASSPRVLADMLETDDGALWIGSGDRGLVRFDPSDESFRAFDYVPTDTTSVASRQIEVVLQRPGESGVLWLGTKAGIDRFDIATGTAKHYGPDQGMADGTIYGMLLDDDGRLWASTNHGISSFDPETETFRNYGLEDGLRELEFQQNGFTRGPDGMMYFGDVGGITAFLPSALTTNPAAPQLAFTALRVVGKRVEPSTDGILKTAIADTPSITLAYAQNEFSVDFVALHFADPSKNSYAYRLEGYDRDWIESGFQRTATYTNLPPGDYTLHVKAANPDGVWNEQGIALGVTILPPWYRTTWAYALFALLFGGFIFSTDRLQRYRVVRKERARAEIEETRLRAEAAEAEAKALAAENERKKNIERLSEIGKEITASLDFETIFGRLYEHVNELTDAPIFGVGVYDAERQTIDYRMAIENGKRYAPYTRDARDKNQFPVWCIDHRKPVFINDVETEYADYIERYVQEEGMLEDGSVAQQPRSLIYLPLETADRVQGVITVQSFEKNAYSNDDLNLLRTMAAYASVALDNSNAYRRLDGTIAELRQTQQQLVQQEKMASLGSLTAGIAHEIKNPLNFVNNFADVNAELAGELQDLVKSGQPLDSARDELEELAMGLNLNAKKISKHGKRADSIIKGMMQHARSGDAERFPVAVNDFVEEYVMLGWHGYRAQHPDANADIVRRYDDSVGNATVVPQDMGRVIVNLVGNALDVLRGRDDGVLTVETARIGDAVTIRISDNGSGVPAGIKSKIFEPFFTTKPSGEGTGLGLSLSHEIVTQGHGGSMLVEDTPGGGATFVVSIPVS